MNRATKIRLYPDSSQKESLSVQFGCARFVWNLALSLKKEAWDQRRENLSCYKIKAMLPAWKQDEYPWLKAADSQALQQSILNLDTAFSKFFEKRSRYPRFKKKHSSRQSIQYPQRVKLKDSLIYLPKIGWVKAKVHRELVGIVKTVTVSRESTGKYYASILTDDGKPETKQLKRITRVIGIDLGIITAVASSDGSKIPNQRFLNRAQRNLRRKQKSLSRKLEAAKLRSKTEHKKLRDCFGNNIAKSRLQVAKAHERVRNSRNDWQHKTSRYLADENQAVCAETLNVKGMLKSRKLSRSISDLGWSGLLSKLDYKLKDKGGRLIKIGRFFPSSKTCSDCGSINDLTLDIRNWTCPDCGTLHDRDINAAVNIKNQGILELKVAGLSVSAHGGRVRPVLNEPAAACEVRSLHL
jgi:putative transposase